MEWEWLKVEKLNQGGVLGPWLNYEAAIMHQSKTHAEKPPRWHWGQSRNTPEGSIGGCIFIQTMPPTRTNEARH